MFWAFLRHAGQSVSMLRYYLSVLVTWFFTPASKEKEKLVIHTRRYQHKPTAFNPRNNFVTNPQTIACSNQIQKETLNIRDMHQVTSRLQGAQGLDATEAQHIPKQKPQNTKK